MSRFNVFFGLLVVFLSTATWLAFYQPSRTHVVSPVNPRVDEPKGFTVVQEAMEAVKVPYRSTLQGPMLKTLSERIEENRLAVMAMERALADAHALERLNSHRLPPSESQDLYNMIDAVAKLRAQGIELRLQRLQARVDGVGR